MKRSLLVQVKNVFIFLSLNERNKTVIAQMRLILMHVIAGMWIFRNDPSSNPYTGRSYPLFCSGGSDDDGVEADIAVTVAGSMSGWVVTST